MQESQTILVGNLTADPVFRVIPSGAAVTSFRIACTPRLRDKETGSWRDGDPVFAGVSCWRHLAENVADTVRRGDRVVVIGRLRLRTWTGNDGLERTSLEVDADTVAPDLNRHTAQLRKVSRSAAGAASSPDGAGAEPDGEAGEPSAAQPAA